MDFSHVNEVGATRVAIAADRRGSGGRFGK